MALLTCGRPCRTGRRRAHAGRRGAERVVTRPGAGTLLATRRRRARAAGRPAAGLASTLAALTTLAARLATTAALRHLRHGRPGGRRARRGGGPLRSRGLRGGTGRTWYQRDGPRRGLGGRRRRSRRSARSLGAVADTVGGRRSTRRGTHRAGRCRSRRSRRSRGPGTTGLRDTRADTPVILPVPIPGLAGAGRTRRCRVRPARAAAARRAGTAGPPLRPGSLSLLAPIGAESFFEPAHDRRLDRRGRRTYELTHFLELDHHGLALNTELFREFVNPDLRHYAPLLGPVSWTPFTRTFPPVRGRACSGLTSACGVHRLVLIERSSLSRPAFPTGCRSCLSLARFAAAGRTGGRDVPRGERPEPVRSWPPALMLCLARASLQAPFHRPLIFPRAGARAEWPGWLARYLLTSAAPSGAGVRKARPNARRRCASSRHSRL